MILERVKELCEKNKISISRLEKECGLGNATVRYWKDSYPKVDTLKKVADYFHVPVDYFLSDNLKK